MNTLHIQDLEFWGKHGQTGDEQQIAQPFAVDITLTYDFTRAIETDDLRDAIDYKQVEKVVQDTIENTSFVLIETLASALVHAVLRETTADRVKVILTKSRPKSIGIPSVTLQHTRELAEKEDTIGLLDFSAEKIKNFYSPDTDGILHLKGILYKILDEEKLREWYQKKWKSFEKKEEKYIQNNQEVSVVFNGPFGDMHPFIDPQERALHQLCYKIRNEIAKYSDIPLVAGDRLETKLIKYPVSKLGVGAHKDLSSNKHCIILFNFYGTTTFYTAKDKERSGEKAYLVEPGDIVLMRGPRNESENDIRPTHYVLDIDEERLVFVCR